jgi:hypothetical protein
MNSPKKLARDALAALFDALEPQKAHWYCIIPPTEDRSSDKMKAYFPLLASLLSIWNDIFKYVLKTGGLVRYISRKAVVPIDSWVKQIKRQQLEMLSLPLICPMMIFLFSMPLESIKVNR